MSRPATTASTPESFDRLGQRLGLAIVPPLAHLVLRMLWWTLRIRLTREDAERLKQVAQPSIFAFWHDQIFVSSAFLIRYLVRRGWRVAFMISPSFDGELVTRTMRPFGLTVVRGSASRQGARALRGLYRSLGKEQASPVILPDGPKGPQFRAKPGTVVLAQTTGAAVVPLAFRSGSALRLGSWDRMQVPLPFSRVDVAVGEIMTVPRELSDADRDAACRELEERLDAVRARAQSAR